MVLLSSEVRDFTEAFQLLPWVEVSDNNTSWSLSESLSAADIERSRKESDL